MAQETKRRRPYGPVVAKTSAYTILRDENGGFFSNTGATAAVTFTLPAAVKGMYFDFINLAGTYELRIDPSGTETIALPSTGAQGAAGKYLTADAIGEWVRIVCAVDGTWNVMGYFGTWTAEA